MRQNHRAARRPVRGTVRRDEVDTHALVTMMIGRETVDESFGVLEIDEQDIVLEAKHLYKKDKAHDVSFRLYTGEILGFYGLVGAGRTETARLLIGEDTLTNGEILIQGQRARIKSVSDSLYRYNMGYITENRKEEGLLLDSPVKTNIAITIWNKIVHPIFQAISPAKETRFAKKWLTPWRSKSPASIKSPKI